MQKKFTFSGRAENTTKTRLSPQKLKSLLQQGAALLKAGQFADAAAIFEQVIQTQPTHASANYYAGYAYHALGDANQAVKFYSNAVKQKPNLIQGWLNLANAYMLLDQFESAEKAFLKAIKLDPNLVQALNGLGMALGAQDKDAEAADYLSRALQLEPSSKEIRNNLVTALIKSENYCKVLEQFDSISIAQMDSISLRHYGVALMGVGRLEQAEQVLLESHQRDLDDQEVIYNLARLYQDQTQYERSLEFFEKLKDKESDVKALSHMGAVLDSMGKFAEAEAVLQKALELNQQDITVLNHLGNAMTGGNKNEAAEAMYRKAIAVNNESALSYNNLGFSLAARGQVDEAVKEYSKAIEIKPDYGESYRNLVTIKKIKDRDNPLIARMIEQLDSGQVSERDQIQFGFALGKVLDDCGDYDLAFHYYKMANDLVAKSKPFNVASFEQHVDHILEVYTADFFDRHFGTMGVESSAPIFVVGMSRSGTTLAEKIIASHPQVYGAGELGKLFEVIKSYETQSQKEYPFAIQPPDKALVETSAKSYVEYISGYLQDDSLAYVVDKMPYNFAHLGFIAVAMPNAKIVHCNRDPIDTCLSNYFQYFPRGISALYDLEQLKSYYQQYQRLVNHWRKVLPLEIFELHYERLTEDQETVTRELIDFLGLDWDDACLQSHRSEASVRTASIWQVRQPIYKKSVQRWRNYEKHLGVLVEAFAE